MWEISSLYCSLPPHNESRAIEDVRQVFIRSEQVHMAVVQAPSPLVPIRASILNSNSSLQPLYNLLPTRTQSELLKLC